MMYAETTTVVISNAWVSVVVGVVLPVITGLLVKVNAPARLKAGVAIIVAGVAAVLIQAIADGGSALITWETARVFLLTYGVQLLTYLGFWKPVVAVNAKAGPGLVG